MDRTPGERIRTGKMVKFSLINSFHPTLPKVNHEAGKFVVFPGKTAPDPFMKNLILAPVLMPIVSAVVAAGSPEMGLATSLVAIGTVDEPPLIQFEGSPVPVSLDDEPKVAEGVETLRVDLDALYESVAATQASIDRVAEQRDEARREVEALTKANHDLLKQQQGFRREMQLARQEAADWKARAGAFAQQADDHGKLADELRSFRAGMLDMMNDFEAMKGDLVAVRAELHDPIERANLKEQLARSEIAREDLEEELEWALVAREKAILEAGRSRQEMEKRIAGLHAEVRAAREIRDELRTTNAGKMKALVDVELLKKELSKSSAITEKAIRELTVARERVVALQAEKKAVARARLLVREEQGRAETLQEQLLKARSEREESRAALVRLTAELQETRASGQESGRQLELATDELDQSRKEVVLLTKAKGGLEELLFRKVAEIRKLKTELRGVHAANEAPGESPIARKAQVTARPAEGDDDAPAATASAD